MKRHEKFENFKCIYIFKRQRSEKSRWEIGDLLAISCNNLVRAEATRVERKIHRLRRRESDVYERESKVINMEISRIVAPTCALHPAGRAARTAAAFA